MQEAPATLPADIGDTGHRDFVHHVSAHATHPDASLWLRGEALTLTPHPHHHLLGLHARVVERNAKIEALAELLRNAPAPPPRHRISLARARWQWLFSYGRECDMRLDSGGLILLSGPNGAGKTAALEALTLGLFGAEAPSRTASKDAAACLINRRKPDGEGAWAEVTFSLDGGRPLRLRREFCDRRGKLARKVSLVDHVSGAVVAAGKAADIWVADHVGTLDDFHLACMITQRGDREPFSLRAADQAAMVDAFVAAPRTAALLAAVDEARRASRWLADAASSAAAATRHFPDDPTDDDLDIAAVNLIDARRSVAVARAMQALVRGLSGDRERDRDGDRHRESDGDRDGDCDRAAFLRQVEAARSAWRKRDPCRPLPDPAEAAPAVLRDLDAAVDAAQAALQRCLADMAASEGVRPPPPPPPPKEGDNPEDLERRVDRYAAAHALLALPAQSPPPAMAAFNHDCWACARNRDAVHGATESDRVARELERLGTGADADVVSTKLRGYRARLQAATAAQRAREEHARWDERSRVCRDATAMAREELACATHRRDATLLAHLLAAAASAAAAAAAVQEGGSAANLQRAEKIKRQARAAVNDADAAMDVARRRFADLRAKRATANAGRARAASLQLASEGLAARADGLREIGRLGEEHQRHAHEAAVCDRVVGQANAILRHAAPGLALYARPLPGATRCFSFWIRTDEAGTDEVPVEKASGFQRAVAGIATRVALSLTGMCPLRCSHIFLDEAFSGFDATNAARLPDLLCAILRVPSVHGVMLVTHDANLRARLASSVEIIAARDDSNAGSNNSTLRLQC